MRISALYLSIGISDHNYIYTPLLIRFFKISEHAFFLLMVKPASWLTLSTLQLFHWFLLVENGIYKIIGYPATHRDASFPIFWGFTNNTFAIDIEQK